MTLDFVHVPPRNTLQRGEPTPVCGVRYEPLGTRSLVSVPQSVWLGCVDIHRCLTWGLRSALRDLSMIRDDGVDDFALIFPLSTPLYVTHAGRSVRVGPDSYTLLSTARPFRTQFGGAQHFAELVIRVSGVVARQHVPFIDECCNQAIQVRPGPARMMRALFDLALEEGKSYPHAQRDRLAAMIIESIAISAFEAPELAVSKRVVHRSSHERIREQARRYIKTRLSDASLSAPAIARHCNVSLRYLHSAFAAVGTTVGTVIRHSRLDQCRAELQSATCGDIKITHVAMRWGFSSSSSFSRAYRQRFKRCPKDDLRTPQSPAAASHA